MQPKAQQSGKVSERMAKCKLFSRQRRKFEKLEILLQKISKILVIFYENLKLRVFIEKLAHLES